MPPLGCEITQASDFFKLAQCVGIFDYFDGATLWLCLSNHFLLDIDGAKIAIAASQAISLWEAFDPQFTAIHASLLSLLCRCGSPSGGRIRADFAEWGDDLPSLH